MTNDDQKNIFTGLRPNTPSSPPTPNIDITNYLDPEKAENDQEFELTPNDLKGYELLNELGETLERELNVFLGESTLNQHRRQGEITRPIYKIPMSSTEQIKIKQNFPTYEKGSLIGFEDLEDVYIKTTQQPESYREIEILDDPSQTNFYATTQK